VSRRKQDRTYSDLYGQSGSRPRTPRQNTTLATTSGWTSNEAQAKGWREDAGHKERALHHLHSELDKEVTPAPAEKDEDRGHRYSYKAAHELRQ